MKFVQLLFFFLLFAQVGLDAQVDSLFSRMQFEMDYRFRIEQDWDSRKSDGTYREDRTRLRYRLRAGATYDKNWYSFGFRLRTGDQRKQQDPQLTLGKAWEEFGTLPLGFEKLFFQGNWKTYRFWLGKNKFPFEKNNELFWSDNVYPEGLFFEKAFHFDSKLLKSISVNLGHFILGSRSGLFGQDAYVQGAQVNFKEVDNLFKFFPSIYIFRNIPNIPDGDHAFLLNYSILHLGTQLTPIKSKKLFVELDFYQNVQDYSEQEAITADFKNQKMGFVAGLQMGDLKKKNSWKLKLSYANLDRYSILDYMAQNDWARWDYSANNSPDGRLSNFRGAEIVLGYSLSEKINLVTKYYTVQQLIPLGSAPETGQRIRFDIDIKI